MVKRTDPLARELSQAADGPYEAQPLAKRAPAARRRVVGMLLVGALLLGIEAAFARGGAAVAGALALGALAWLVRGERLAGLIGAALAAILAFALPLAFWRLDGADAGEIVRALVSVGLAVGAAPDIVTLARDAELQYAYGRWAERHE